MRARLRRGWVVGLAVLLVELAVLLLKVGLPDRLLGRGATGSTSGFCETTTLWLRDLDWDWEGDGCRWCRRLVDDTEVPEPIWAEYISRRLHKQREKRWTNMRLEMRTCSYSGLRGFASLMCERR